jgi:hypothetical protein
MASVYRSVFMMLGVAGVQIEPAFELGVHASGGADRAMRR